MKSPTLCRGGAQQRQTKQADEYDGDDQGALHLLGVITPFCIQAQRPDAIRFIAPQPRRRSHWRGWKEFAASRR